MPRKSAYPAYALIKAAMDSCRNPELLDLGDSSRIWIGRMKNSIKHLIIDKLHYYCDIVAGPRMNNQQARQVCPQVCGHDKWNGQWTNTRNTSVCGCACGRH